MADTLDPMQIVVRILTENGPLGKDVIVARLKDNGVADAGDVIDELLDEMASPVRQLIDERWTWLPAVVDGRMFTHRVDADELDHDFLRVYPDLDSLTDLCEYVEYQRFADGTAAHVAMPGYDDDLLEERHIPLDVIDEPGVLLLAPGTLGRLGVREGEMVGLRLESQGLVVERIAATAQVSTVGARLKALVDDADEPVSLQEAVWTELVEDPSAFTEPLSPLGEIIEESGLIHQTGLLAPAEFDFDAWRFELNCKMLAREHDLDQDDAFALYTLIRIFDRMSMALESGEESVPESLFALTAEVGGVLADPQLAAVFADRTIRAGRRGAAALGLFAETLEPEAPRAARVAYRWLRALALEQLGEVEAAESQLLAAESMDPDWPMTLLELARFASDRGDAERGLSLLHRAGIPPDYHLVQLLEQHRAEAHADIGRNQPCWCGSGRKYKKCHLGREALPLQDRVRWLFAKAAQHVSMTDWEEVLFEVALERSQYFEGDSREALDAAISDSLVMDAVLFEGGALADFLDVRGFLLPEDERLLAEQWLLSDRSVFDVEQVRPGRGVTVRDVRTGDTYDIRERQASRGLKPGQLICARVIPAGDTMQFSGSVEPVALHERDALIELLDNEPDPATLVEQLSRRFAPPRLTNTEGEPTVLCEATVRVGPGIEAALDEIYDRPDESPLWLEHVVTHGMRRVRATLELDGDALRVRTNSEQRMDRVLAALAALDPEVEVLDDARVSVPTVREATALAERMPQTGEGMLDPADPQVSAALTEFIREYETKWLDEPIPALDGHTPRQAADDPTRRDDLIRLLNTFPVGEAARGGMDSDRLRAALGLIQPG